MKLHTTANLAAWLLWPAALTAASPLQKRGAQFPQGQPIDANGKGGPILGESLSLRVSS